MVKMANLILNILYNNNNTEAEFGKKNIKRNPLHGSTD